MDRLIQMILKLVLRRVIRRGPRTRLNPPSPRKTSALKPTPPSDDAANARKARQAANLARKLGR
jgi:hypothetical protein